RRLLVMHGDEFDSVVRCGKFLAVLGNHAYEALLKLNRAVNFFRRKFGFPYWSLAAWIKHKVKNAVNYISDFEKALAREAKQRGVDGLVCGHIHRAEISRIEDILYCNDGDWVESCTALVERRDGGLRLMHWADIKESMKDEKTLVVERAA
ncbi:MAG: UDP-2,3-diacylglucosamine diphosphatase, partial [Pseudomonadota bacterium]